MKTSGQNVKKARLDCIAEEIVNSIKEFYVINFFLMYIIQYKFLTLTTLCMYHYSISYCTIFSVSLAFLPGAAARMFPE